jgi:hypothetical protein
MAYGLEIYASNGTKLISNTSRAARAATSGTTSSITTGNYLDVSVSGMTSADDWQVFAAPVSPPSSQYARFHTITRNTGYFRVQNDMGVTSAFDYIVIRSG